MKKEIFTPILKLEKSFLHTCKHFNFLISLIIFLARNDLIFTFFFSHVMHNRHDVVINEVVGKLYDVVVIIVAEDGDVVEFKVVDAVGVVGVAYSIVR